MNFIKAVRRKKSFHHVDLNNLRNGPWIALIVTNQIYKEIF